MKIREVVLETDLPEISRWFEKRRWPQPPIDGIGPDFGLICEQDGVSIACCFIYLTGRAIAFIEWCGTNPDVDQAIATTGFSAIIEHMKRMCEVSQEPKIRALHLNTKNKLFASHLESNGFKREDGFVRMLWTSK